MIYVCIKCSESHMVGFLGRILCTSAYGCIFVCIVVRDFRQSRSNMRQDFQMMFTTQVIYHYPVLVSIKKNMSVCKYVG